MEITPQQRIRMGHRMAIRKNQVSFKAQRRKPTAGPVINPNATVVTATLQTIFQETSGLTALGSLTIRIVVHNIRISRIKVQIMELRVRMKIIISNKASVVKTQSAE